MRNSYKYTKMYSGAEPVFLEGDIFKIIIPLSTGAMTKTGPGTDLMDDSHIKRGTGIETKYTETEKTIIEFIKADPTITITKMAEKSKRSRNGIQYAIDSLKAKGKLRREGSRKNGRWILNL